MNPSRAVFDVGQGQGGNSYEFSPRGKSCVW
jgi:hypothetical protein